MYTTEIIIYVIIIAIIVILGSLLVTLTVHDSRNDRKQKKEYQEYVESIKIGDTFGNDLFKVYDVDNPFSENYNTMGFNSDYCVTILDIKKNNKGETWVKYCFTRVLNEHHCEWTDEINNFLKYRTRISRRIVNINTRED